MLMWLLLPEVACKDQLSYIEIHNFRKVNRDSFAKCLNVQANSLLKEKKDQ